MTRTRLLLAGTASALAGAVVLLGGAFGGSAPDRLAVDRRGADNTALVAGFSTQEVSAIVARLESRLATQSEDTELLTKLGFAYQQLARETADPTFYPRSEEMLHRALRLEPDNALALTGLASLAASRHRFDESLELARRVERLAPRSPAVYGLLGDALLEVGRYPEAFAAFDRLASLKPGTVAYARVSYARELLGRTGAAVRAMKMAVTAAGASGEPAAWANTQLGNLYLNSGRLGPAREAFDRALSAFPQYAPALAGLARAQWWRGRLLPAARLYTVALERAPAPDSAVALGDVYAQMGHHADAERAYRKAEELERAFAANGGRNQLETALFDLDHDRNVADALRRARVGRDLRPSVEGEHVLAWALYKNGRCSEAKKHSIRALRLGTKDIGAMLHRSFIEACLGNRDAAEAWRAQALVANPYALMTVGSPRIHRRS